MNGTALITTGAAGIQTKGLLLTKGAIFSGVTSGLLSFGFTEATTGNAGLALLFSVLSSAISATLVAYFSNRPKYIEAVSHARISESELLGKQTSELISTLKQTADDNSRVATLQVFARHKIQGFLQAYQSHIDLCHMIMQEHDVKIPTFKTADVDSVLTELDERIDAIKNRR